MGGAGRLVLGALALAWSAAPALAEATRGASPAPEPYGCRQLAPSAEEGALRSGLDDMCVEATAVHSLTLRSPHTRRESTHFGT